MEYLNAFFSELDKFSFKIYSDELENQRNDTDILRANFIRKMTKVAFDRFSNLNNRELNKLQTFVSNALNNYLELNESQRLLRFKQIEQFERKYQNCIAEYESVFLTPKKRVELESELFKLEFDKIENRGLSVEQSENLVKKILSDIQRGYEYVPRPESDMDILKNGSIDQLKELENRLSDKIKSNYVSEYNKMLHQLRPIIDETNLMKFTIIKKYLICDTEEFMKLNVFVGSGDVKTMLLIKHNAILELKERIKDLIPDINKVNIELIPATAQVVEVVKAKRINTVAEGKKARLISRYLILIKGKTYKQTIDTLVFEFEKEWNVGNSATDLENRANQIGRFIRDYKKQLTTTNKNQ